MSKLEIQVCLDDLNQKIIDFYLNNNFNAKACDRSELDKILDQIEFLENQLDLAGN